MFTVYGLVFFFLFTLQENNDLWAFGFFKDKIKHNNFTDYEMLFHYYSI